jgi:hypothetical protein
MSQLRRFLKESGCVFAERLDDRYDWRKRYNDNISGITIEKGPFGNNFVLDGSNPDYAAVAADTYRGKLIGTEDFSLAIWIKNSLTLASSSNVYVLVADKQTANNSAIGYCLQLKGGSVDKGLILRMNDGGQAIDDVVRFSTDRTTLLSDGNWHLIAVTVDRSDGAVLYVDDFDGEGIGSISGQSNTLFNDQDLTLGVYSNKTTQPFTGSMRNFIMFKDRLLTSNERLGIYKGTFF